MTKPAYREFGDLVTKVLAAKDYSEDIQQTSWDELYMDPECIPSKEDRDWLESCGRVWDHLINEDYMIENEHVFESSNLFTTPTKPDFLNEFLQGVPSDQHASIYMAVQMTINYINSKE